MTTTAPRWDTSYLFPALGSREYESARESIDASLVRLEALFDKHNVRGGEVTLDEATVTAFEEVLDAANAVMAEIEPVEAFVYAYISTDASDDLANRELAASEAAEARFKALRSRLDAWIAALGPSALAERSTMADDHRHPLERAAVRAAHQMSEGEESLYAELSLTGSSAWANLHRTVSAAVTVDGKPISEVRGLAYSADAAVRRSAYLAELEAWEQVQDVLAACLNGINGERAVVNARRGWPDALEPALAANDVDRETLTAMQDAVVDSLPAFRRYLRAKAAYLGSSGANGGVPWYDIAAPISGDDTIDWDTAAGAVRQAFAGFSPSLAGLADRAFAEQWVDADTRPGKRDGAFCMPVQGDRSLVLLNFTGSARDVSTLAHELGHAYHNVALADRSPLQRQLTMALAETASIFCETILVDHALAGATPESRLAVLEADLETATLTVVDIHSRFLFERAMTELRARRLVPARELCGLMVSAQQEAYGDGLDWDHLHPWMWAVKPHYYATPFYNWPYTFGHLFGLGLFARFKEAPEEFRSRYDDLLSSTGLAGAAELAARFGIDVRDKGFWAAGLSVIEARCDEFASLVAG